MTHYHIDHAFLASIFENAVLMDLETIYQGDHESAYDNHVPVYKYPIINDTPMFVIPTPGHANEHCSLHVESEKGVILVNGDVFWWYDSEIQNTDDYDLLINKSDDFANDIEALKKSRKMTLEIADYIIPGHGEMFQNKFKGKNTSLNRKY